MRRILISFGSAGLLTLALAATAFGAHCVNESKQAGAGVHGVVLLDPVTFEATFEGANAGGRLPGGFADVYIDVDDSGTLSAGDVQIEDDIFLAANHSHKDNPAQGVPSILPPILAGADPGGDGHGIGVIEH
ncbi:MAG TPA: hypothetical protein VEW95_06555 [Candidatus Limnocylindrales bacterium]|nr:hypothetical protein [Candidatus Limnocylindrales bacterium]